jgi:carboxymethylenebutenolidase
MLKSNHAQQQEDPMALDRRIVELYDEYTHKPLDRRVFMNRLLLLAGSTAAAEAAIALLEPNYAQAQQIAPDDARLTATRLDQSVDGVALKGYLVVPKAPARRGGVLVIHENRGLNPHIEDITRRMALAGFSALGLDFLTPWVARLPILTPRARCLLNCRPTKSSSRVVPR